MEWLHQSPILLLIAVLVVAFLESFALLGILVPGVVLLFSLSALAYSLELSPFILLLFGATGACLGDISSYWLGRKFRSRIETLHWFRQHISWLDHGRWFINKWGWLSVIIGRFLGPLRPVIPLVAGTLDMKVRLFVPLNILTVLVWAPAYLLPGYYTGELAELWRIQPLGTRSIIIYLLSAISITAGALTIYHHTQPERWHLRGWITQRQADRWPVGPIALILIAGVITAVLLLWPPAAQDVQFQTWSALWQESALSPAWMIGLYLADARLIILFGLCLVCWLLMVNRESLALLTIGIAVPMLLVNLFWVAPSVGITATEQFISLIIYTFFTGFMANLASSQVTRLRRWPVYSIAGLFIIFGLFSHIWIGDLLLSQSGLAVLIALISSSILRAAWQTLGLPLSVRISVPFGILMLITAVAWVGLRL